MVYEVKYICENGHEFDESELEERVEIDPYESSRGRPPHRVAVDCCPVCDSDSLFEVDEEEMEE